MKPLWTRFSRCLADFRAARGGNIAATFALAALPVLGTVGFAVDYSHANSVKVAMQSALDATALMLAKDASKLGTSDLQSKAETYFKALFIRPEATNIAIEASYTSSGGSTVVVTGSANVPTAFLGIIGYDKLVVNGSSTSKWGTSALQVALVLDTTGSMDDDGKMPAMKSATKSLLTQFQNAATNNGDIYVSIITFSKNVNVGSSYYNASWVDWTDWEAEPPYMATWLNNSSNKSTWEATGPGDSCPWSSSSVGFSCTKTPANDASSTSTIPSSGTYKGYICPGKDSGRKIGELSSVYYNGCYDSTEQTKTISTGRNASCGSTSNCSCSGSGSSKKCVQTYYTHTWIPNARSTWTGCVTDRGLYAGPTSSNYDQKTDAPGSSADSKFPAQQYANCTTAMMGLSYNWSAMTSLVNSLEPSGNTNQPIGLVWGWQSLVGGGPLSVPATPSGVTYDKVIILLSDGMNTGNRWDTTQNAVDKRMYNSSDGSGTCANIKAAGITIYTIQVNTGNDPTSSLLKNCASKDSYFYILTSASQIIDAFTEIGTSLTKLRVAK